MQIGMLAHIQKWIFHFMKTHERLDKYNAIWFSEPAYHDLTPITKSYEEASQCNEKEMKDMSRYLLGVVTQSLQGGSPAQCPLFNCAIQFTWALFEFYTYARYISHDDVTFIYMEDAWCRLHTFKDVFLLCQAGKNVNAKANALRTELVKKQKVDEETNAETLMPSKKRREIHSWRNSISHQIDVSKEFDAYFIFLNIHLMSHWVEQIRRHTVLQQYSVVRDEQAHKTYLKDCWKVSNQNLNYLQQVSTIHRHILCFVISELNLQALAQRQENSGATWTVLPFGADLADPVSSQSSAKPELMGPQNRCDGKHSDAMIKDFRALLDYTPDATHRMRLYTGKQ
jgi:hypothetical protein